MERCPVCNEAVSEQDSGFNSHICQMLGIRLWWQGAYWTIQKAHLDWLGAVEPAAATA